MLFSVWRQPISTLSYGYAVANRRDRVVQGFIGPHVHHHITRSDDGQAELVRNILNQLPMLDVFISVMQRECNTRTARRRLNEPSSLTFNLLIICTVTWRQNELTVRKPTEMNQVAGRHRDIAWPDLIRAFICAHSTHCNQLTQIPVAVAIGRKNNQIERRTMVLRRHGHLAANDQMQAKFFCG